MSGQNGSGNGQSNGGPPGVATLQKMLNDPERLASLKKMMPKNLTPERLAKVALAAWSKTPALQKVSLSSLWSALQAAAELGLEPGGALGHLYLVPFGQVCTPIIGYRGFIELARRSGQLSQIEAHIVFDKDTYEVEFGLTPKLRHVPKLDGDRGKPVFTYMLARLRDGSTHLEVMTMGEVDKIRSRSRAAQGGPWVTDYEEMAKKTVIRRGMKYLPLSAELQKAIEVDDQDYVDGEVLGEPPPATETGAAPKALSAGNEAAKAAIRARKMQVVEVQPGQTEEQAFANATEQHDATTGEVLPPA